MSRKVLAVDDDKHIIRLVETNLRKEGYEVLIAGNGREALDLAVAHQPDLVVMDVTMPEMDGLEALKQLKENPATAAIPVIMLTAKAEDADIFQGWQHGADVYLLKPFKPKQLIAAIHEVMQSSDETKTVPLPGAAPDPGKPAPESAPQSPRKERLGWLRRR